MAGDRQLISVRTDVVLSVMVHSLFDDARAIGTGSPGEAAHDALRLAPRALAVSGDRGRPDAAGVLVGLARMGWRVRESELERFAPARDVPHAALNASLTAGDWQHAADVCVTLAQAEPIGRPDPDDPDSVSWQIPGPGGHVRHYVALRCIGALEGGVDVERDAGVDDPTELKRVWLYGFLLAEAARLRHARATPSPRGT